MIDAKREYLERLEERDKKEKQGLLPNLINSHYELQMTMSSDEGAVNRTMSLGASVMGGSFMGQSAEVDFDEQISKFQRQLTEQKRTNTQLSKQLINLTTILAEKDTQLLDQDKAKFQLEQLKNKMDQFAELECKNKELLETQEFHKREIAGHQEIINNLQKELATQQQENQRFLDEIMRIKTKQAEDLDA